MVVLGTSLAQAWTAKPVKEDQNLFMPGTQQGAVALQKAANDCMSCHSGYDLIAEPGRNWQGSMMGQAARDPLWLACLTVADQDSIWALGNPNAGDLCIRCHTPIGWLGGRSDPPNASALTASTGDFESINCDSCHRMLDPFNALHQPGLPPETNATAISEDTITTNVDNTVLQTLLLFNSNAFYNASTRLPVYYGTGDITNYSEATSGQYFMDTINAKYKRGPYYDASPASHNPYYSRFHKSSGMCATCHDVSNPALANVVLGTGVPEFQAAGSYFHVERTLSEFKLSAYGRGNGTNVNPGITTTNLAWASTCQDCHMRMVTGKACNKNVQVRTNIAMHDLTGGNAWLSTILASVDQGDPVYSAYNYNILSGAKYAGAQIDVAGLQGLGPQLTNGAQRALTQLRMAATLEVISNTASETILRIINNTGHKLISGFPEGRRMWLNVKFYDGAETPIGESEINPYSPLVVATNAGNIVYVSGGDLSKTRDDLVYETAMMSSLTAEDHTFHFVLATDRYKDNRIPPKGFDIANAASRKAQPRWDGADATNYFTAAEYTGGYDEVTFTKPAGTARWVASMYYQTTSKDYVEFLRNEILATNTLTLSSPTPSGETNAYIAQTDSFFTTLKGWGNAIYDLWLANGGAAPVLMTTTNVLNPAVPAPVVTVITPMCGPVEGGTVISITGSNFQAGATVNIADSAVVNGGTNITAVTIANTAGLKDVTVTNPDAQSGTLSNAFTFAAPPVFAGLETAAPAVESATLTWSAASSAYPVSYSVFESLTSGGQDFMTPLLTTNALSAYVAPLDPGTTNWLTYYFVVRASDECGGSELNTVELSVQPLLDPSKDQDSDGMPNSYEQAYSLDPFNAADAGLDPDTDGFTSLQESIAGTSPIDGNDFPKIESVTQDVAGIHIWFQTVSGRQYQVQSRDSLATGSWTDLGTPVNGDDTLRDVTDTPSPGAVARFYRLVITRP